MSKQKDKLAAVLVAKYGDKILENPRVKAELDFIREKDLSSQLLDIYEQSQKFGVHGDTNSTNSAIAYLLNLTSVKPTAPFSLEKRRIYARSGFPDVDIDVDYASRHVVVDYLRGKYGEEYVAPIGVVQRLKSKAAVHRVVKALDPEDNLAYDKKGNKIRGDESETHRLGLRISDTLPKIMKHADGSYVHNADEAVQEYKEFARFMNYYPEVYDAILHLEDTISAYGVHAGGIVISSEPLSQIAPLHITRGSGLATQFTMSEVESLGLIKIDVLGLATKSIISMIHRLIKERHDIDIDLTRLPLNDPSTIALISSGKTDGVFQLKSRGMKAAIAQIGFNSFADLMAIIAMYRPGPMDYIEEFGQRKAGKKRVIYAHPDMEKITKDTQGIITYQEQTFQVFMLLADLGTTDGYKFLKGCAKKNEKLIQEYEHKFKNGCKNRGITTEVANHVWDDLKKFSGYAFNMCLSGSTLLQDATTGDMHTLQSLASSQNCGHGLKVLSKVLDNTQQISVIDEVEEVFSTGYKMLYQVQLSTGMLIECTMDHKFLCADNEFHTISEILEDDLEILTEDINYTYRGS